MVWLLSTHLTKRTKSAKMSYVTTKGDTVAAGQLSAPGTEYGPCALGDNGEYLCEHIDCFSDYGLANTPCKYCAERIGFGAMFYKLSDDWTDLAHQLCHLEDIEASKP